MNLSCSFEIIAKTGNDTEYTNRFLIKRWTYDLETKINTPYYTVELWLYESDKRYPSRATCSKYKHLKTAMRNFNRYVRS